MVLVSAGIVAASLDMVEKPEQKALPSVTAEISRKIISSTFPQGMPSGIPNAEALTEKLNKLSRMAEMWDSATPAQSRTSADKRLMKVRGLADRLARELQGVDADVHLRRQVELACIASARKAGGEMAGEAPDLAPLDPAFARVTRAFQSVSDIAAWLGEWEKSKLIGEYGAFATLEGPRSGAEWLRLVALPRLFTETFHRPFALSGNGDDGGDPNSPAGRFVVAALNAMGRTVTNAALRKQHSRRRSAKLAVEGT